MHDTEKELIKATGYTSRKKYADRQDYLGSILNASTKLTDDDFDNLTDPAAAWVNAAIQAQNSKEDIPDFDEEFEDPEDEPEDEEVAEASEPEDESEDEDPEDEPEDEDEAPEDDEPEEEDEPEEVVQAKKPAKKAPPAKKAAAPKKEPAKKVVPPAKKPLPKPPGHKSGEDLDAEPEVILDKWGCMEGSKNGRALAMFEKGATTREVKDALDGTFYNILKKMVQDGHTVDKEGSLIKLTHRDANKPVKKKK